MSALLSLRQLHARGVIYAAGYETAIQFVQGDRPADLVIAPDGEPYLYRWHVARRNRQGNVYLHLQVASDPERPLHDHPWDNQSVILAGAYDEIVGERKGDGVRTSIVPRGVGQVIQRKAGDLHRLLLPKQVPYTLTLFTTGPVTRDWGFLVNGRWMSHEVCVETLPDGRSIWVGPKSV